MDDVAILEDGIELIYESKAQQQQLNQAKIDRCAAEWKNLTGRDHPGSFDGEHVWFRYHDWAVLVDEWVIPSHWTESSDYIRYDYRFYFFRTCMSCGRAKRWLKPGHSSHIATEVKTLSDLQRAYKETECTRRKCRRKQILDSR